MRIPFRSFATLVLAVGVATCSDAPSVAPKPAAPVAGHGRLALAPVFSRAAAEVYAQRAAFAVTFDHVRIVIVRPPSDTVKDTTIVFNPNSPPQTVDLDVTVTTTGETFTGALDYTNNGAVVFHGEAPVQSHPPGTPAPPTQEIVVQYVGQGATATKLVVAPKTVALVAPAGTAFSATAFGAANAAVAGAAAAGAAPPATGAAINTTTP